MGTFGVISDVLSQLYQEFLLKKESFPFFFSFIQIALLVVLITVVALAIFSFYKSLGKKDLISLNLYTYNRYDHPTMKKIFAVILYLIEYILIIPFFIILWSLILSVTLLLLIDSNVGYVVLLTAALIASIRILAYYRGEISKDLAKLFPFFTLSVFLINAKNFDMERIISQVSQIPQLLNSIYIYMLFIFIVEIFLRFTDTSSKFLRSEEAETED